jgi:small conductance mechanosensitive channel
MVIRLMKALRSRHQILILLTLVVLLIGLWGGVAATIVSAQLPSFTTPTTSPQLPPTNVQRRGTLESVAIRLDGQELFRIASPTVLNRTDPGTQIPVEVRAKQVEANLSQVISDVSEADAGDLNPNALQVFIETMQGQPVLYAKDTLLPEAMVLLTVTTADAQYHSVSQKVLADRWQAILEKELRQALELRKPEAFRRQVRSVVSTLVATTIATLTLGTIWFMLGRQKLRLDRQQANQAKVPQAQILSPPGSTPIEPDLEVFQGLRQHFNVQRRLQLVRFLRWLLFWGIAFVWTSGIAYSLSVFPQTRQLARRVITVPVVLLLTWFLTGLVNRLTDLATDRFIQSRELEQSLTEANLQRITTIANVIKGVKTVLLYLIAILWALQWLHLVPGSLLTLGALLALVISLAAQNLVKDLVNGFLILLEDQFRIGDMIRIGTTNGLNEILGLVENLNLRITQLRNPEGNLISIPNSSIVQVENMSRTWARTDFQIEVAYDTDVDLALKVFQETVAQMAQDPDWQPVIFDTQELFGVEQLSHTGILIRNWIKTAPLQQWAVARELRRRLKIAFDRHQIQIGTPQQVWLDNEANHHTLEPHNFSQQHQPDNAE